ncbi:hypothetical protein EHV15_12080 [Paenibacillus oralis]|uniref:Uncharacterized protein n=1 Tax=Paenibacillus oralis TaxID=2490856 RepID=A0A3P3U4T2_9BACL|nr:hypothetical protein [Paenibacillus oralis]RRJ63583.1 hypothetical protein EHV15_12080 [Paenibacillus oralis]
MRVEQSQLPRNAKGHASFVEIPRKWLAKCKTAVHFRLKDTFLSHSPKTDVLLHFNRSNREDLRKMKCTFAVDPVKRRRYQRNKREAKRAALKEKARQGLNALPDFFPFCRCKIISLPCRT